MEILIDYKYKEDDVAPLEVSELAQFVLEAERVPPRADVSITFVDNDEMAELNEQFRGKIGPTDVLSFECDSIDDDMLPVVCAEDFFELGDVIVAPDVARAQCELYENTFQEEIELLLVHGLLHLCGYDHIDDDEALEMEARERELLSAWRKTHGRPANLNEVDISHATGIDAMPNIEQA
jgi:probable rRNA maturation factor